MNPSSSVLAAARAALAAVPLAVAATEADAQLTLSAVEAGFIDVSGDRFAFESVAESDGRFVSAGLFDLDLRLGSEGFSLTGDLAFSGTQYTQGAGDNLEVGANLRYLRIYGSWEGDQTGNEPLPLSLAGEATFSGNLIWVQLAYNDLSYSDSRLAGALVSGESYTLDYDASSSFTPGVRGAFVIDLVYYWEPSPPDASSTLTDNISLSVGTAPIPEPGAAAALAGGAGLLLAITRRRRRG